MLLASSALRRRRNHAAMKSGFTLVELLIVMVLMAVVGGALTTVLLRQQRFFRGAGDVMDTRNQMRSAVDILSAELRGISASGGDIIAGSMGTTSIEFRSTFGSSVACRIVGLNQIYLPPNADLAAGNRLTFLGARPVVGNGVFILDESATGALSDDVWQLRTITAVADAVDPCVGSGYTGAGDATKTGLLLTLNAVLPNTVAAGAPVRLVNRVRYGLYSESNGKWYLGYCQSADITTTCGSLEPVSGPYRALDADASSGQSGLNFYYYDENGNATADRLLVSRMEIAVRGVSGNLVSRGGEAATTYFRDTSRVIIGLRNRR